MPRAGGRILETGTEDFLKLKRDRALGESAFIPWFLFSDEHFLTYYPSMLVPVVAVLTKYDMFMDRVERALVDINLDDLSEDAAKDLVRKRAEAELHVVCVQSLQKLTGSHIPYAVVSSTYRPPCFKL